MLVTSAKSSPAIISLPSASDFFISSHKLNEFGGIVFIYRFQISVDTTQYGNLDGDIQMRAYTVNKTDPPVQIKKSDIVGKNFLKVINKQRTENLINKSLGKKAFAKKFVDRPDLKKSTINFYMEIPDSKVSDSFSIDAVNILRNGIENILGTVTVNHQDCLKKYDLPVPDFNLTTCRQDEKIIHVSAATSDPLIGSFIFSFRNDAGFTFEKPVFTVNKTQAIDDTKSASTFFEVDDVNQKYTVRAYPISRFLNQRLGNYKEESASFVESQKYLPFYVSSLENSYVSFNVPYVGNTISRVFLYRKNIQSQIREFISYSDYGTGGAFLIDSEKNSNLEYSYSVDYLEKTGIMKSSLGEVIIQPLKLDKLAKISVSSLGITENSQDTSVVKDSNQKFANFEVAIEYDTSTLYDQTIEDLKTLGLENLYSNDLEKMTNNLKPITRALVSKISKITGIESYVGVYKTGKISIPIDNNEESIFRFEAAVRSVPELLENITSAQSVLANSSYNKGSQIDLSSKLIGNKSKIDNPNFSAKFFSRSSIQGSTLRYGKAANLGDLGYFAGRTGVFKDINITNSKTQIKISSIQILETKNGYYATWRFFGNAADIDNFMVKFDEKVGYSMPINSSQQIFFLGKSKPTNVTVEIVYNRISATTTQAG